MRRLLFILGVLGLVGVSVAALGIASDSPAAWGGTASAGEGSSQAGSGVGDGPSSPDPALMARARRAALARRRWLGSPGAHAQRVRSQTAYHGVGVAAARGLLERDFGSALAGASADPAATIARSGRVLQYRGDYSALVSTPQGLRVESSTVPLHVPGGRGGGGPVDLSLVGDRAGFAPARPLTGVSIARHLSGGVTVGGDGVGVSLLGADVAGGMVDGRDVFFGGVGRDLDAVVAPKLDGADLSVVLRSRLAPEQFRYKVALPVGAVLQAVGGGAMVSRGGMALVRIPAPSARDAQGSVVPVQMAVSGNELVLTVAHREHELAYPVLVDPEIVVNLTENAGSWEFYSTSDNPFYCEGTASGETENGGCPEGDPLFSHTGPGGGSPLTITMPSVSVPFIKTRYNKSTEKNEEVEITGGSAEWWWKPSGTEGITSIEFEGISSSGFTESEGSVEWVLEACRQGRSWTFTEGAPT